MAKSLEMSHSLLIIILLLAVLLCVGPAQARPAASRKLRGYLSTESRWIVDGSGKRVKLACVNWPSHLQPVLAEGLSHQPVDKIIKKIKSMGFNCARFTWPVLLATNDSLASLTVTQSFQNLGLNQALAGIKKNNPWAVDLTLIDAFKAMLDRFDTNNVMVVLDNHITEPGWCCAEQDGNGFFGDKFFDPNLWELSLSKMAKIATEFPIVVGVSLRNELRGPKSNVTDWYKYMQRGAEAVHSSNPNVLVIISGLRFDVDLSFLHSRPINVSFTNKLVFELHWYSFADSDAWTGMNLNDICGLTLDKMMNQGGFLTHKGFEYPLFFSEFGMNLQGTREADNRYIGCVLALAAAEDWDFAVWALQGDYYLRQGIVGLEETYGLLDKSWNNVRNSSLLLDRLASLQRPFRGPGVGETTGSHVLYHPKTGLCVTKGPSAKPLRLGPCQRAQWWIHTPALTLQTARSSFLQAVGVNKPGKLVNAADGASQWNVTSNSKLHLSAWAGDGTVVCLDVDGMGNVVTNACKCLAGDKWCDPTSQWFKLVESTVV